MAHLSDDALEALIRSDEIDVLVDLSGHSAGNRLPVFARKPAPIQVTAWGYATGTGLETMDAFLIDRVVVPPHERAEYAEAIVELPSPICFERPAELPPISALPARSRGYVTFGTFNRLPKVSAGVRDAWAAVLNSVPGSRLVVKAAPRTPRARASGSWTTSQRAGSRRSGSPCSGTPRAWSTWRRTARSTWCWTRSRTPAA